MLKTTLKDLLAKKLRLFTTGLAVLLGVAFMAGTLVLTDTVGRSFDRLFADVSAGVDAYVRSASEIDADWDVSRARVDAGLADAIAAVPGVAAVEGTINGYAQIVDRDGEPMGDMNGAPTFGGNWNRAEGLNPFRLAAGRAPEADDEVVVDKRSADEAGFEVGDTVTVLTNAGPSQLELVGIARFGDADSPGGASFALFTDATAQRLVAQPGTYDAFAVVAEEGVAEEALRDDIAAALDDDVEVLTGAEITAENQDDIKEGLAFFGMFLLTFALIALFVGSFIIYNTFSIIVAQRTREMALLRAIGASRRQVLASVLLEALIVGVVASVAGLLLGIGVASGLKALLDALGVDIPGGSLVVTRDTIVIALLVGTLVSVVSAVVPARRASRVSPLAAMRDVAVDTAHSSPRRVVAGTLVVAVGSAAMLGGLYGDAGAAAVGLGSALVFVGVAILGPIVARPVSRLVGSPLPRLRGMAGTLARENALRNPKRTSATAAALMVGVGLVAFITIFGSSAKASVNRLVDRSFTGDFVIEARTWQGGLSPDVTSQLGARPEVGVATGVRRGVVEIDGNGTTVTAVDPSTFPAIIDLGVVDGSLDDLGRSEIAVLDEVADDNGWSVGDRIPVRFSETGVQHLRLAALFTEDELAGRYVVGLEAFEANVADQFDTFVLVTVAEGTSPEEARAAVEEVAAAHPNAEVQDQTEFKASQASEIDALLNLVYALLGLAILIALLGIANTLALSIFERTRELGLLRAVGMTRGQLRSTVRWESVIIALLGTLLGLVVGLFFAWAIVQSLEAEGFTAFRVPVGQLAFITLIGGIAGVAAAVLPARRAARLDVLAAIATE